MEATVTMINKLKTIAVFGCQFTGRYRQNLCRSFSIAAKELGLNLVFFNSLGKIGNKDAQYGDYEFDLIESIGLEQFDGIVFDGEGYNVEGMADKVITKLRTAKCPVVSISSYVEGFYNIEFDDAMGIRTITEHFINEHKFTRIGYMSGYLTHPDAQLRLKVFRSVMKEHGMPEDGAGMFEGDFWFHKGEEAADYFLSKPERPQAVVCANDYMAIALATALKNRNIKVPEEIAVSGFDGTVEGQEFLPHITSGTRERLDIARKALKLISDICDGKKPDLDLKVLPGIIISQSCGCKKLDYKREAENINHVYELNRNFSYNLYDAESSMLKLNKADTINDVQNIFVEASVNFGAYSSFFLMMHIDRSGRTAQNSDFISSTGKFTPAIIVDKKGEYTLEGKEFNTSDLLPESKNEDPHSFYIMSTHCAERTFGYVIIEMSGLDVFNEFYNVWLLNMSMALETMLKNDRIKKLIGTLEDLSIRDGLTGMLNRRGFDELSRDAIRSIENSVEVCTMVIDMDGLKHINDDYGHHEGDRAIKAAANIITKCCNSGEIAGRAGGDEFYIFALEYTEKKLERFVTRLNSLIDGYNSGGERPYKVELSWGAYLCKVDKNGRLEDYLKESDARMYEQKHSKPNRRK